MTAAAASGTISPLLLNSPLGLNAGTLNGPYVAGAAGMAVQAATSAGMTAVPLPPRR